MKKLMAMTVMVIALAGCGSELKAAARKQGRVVPPSLYRMHCKGTAYLLDDGQLYCDGKVVADVDGYVAPKTNTKDAKK
jgi:hypothetical protein